MLAQEDQHLRWLDAVAAAHEWRDEQRAQYDAAVQRIVDQGQAAPDPAGRGVRRVA